MSFETNIFLLLGAVLVLAIINVFLVVYCYLSSKKVDILLEKGKIKDFKELLFSQKEKNDDLAEQIKSAFLKIGILEELSRKTIQKVGIVRFNPFNGMGGDQSFAIALLDDRNTGFVISSLFVGEGNRVYAKALKNGKSDHALSAEEKQAIEKALKS